MAFSVWPRAHSCVLIVHFFWCSLLPRVKSKVALLLCFAGAWLGRTDRRCGSVSVLEAVQTPPVELNSKQLRASVSVSLKNRRDWLSPGRRTRCLFKSLPFTMNISPCVRERPLTDASLQHGRDKRCVQTDSSTASKHAASENNNECSEENNVPELFLWRHPANYIKLY